MEKVLAISELKDELIKDAVKKAVSLLISNHEVSVYTILLAKGQNSYPILIQIYKHNDTICIWVNDDFPQLNIIAQKALKCSSIERRVAKAFEDTGLAERARKDTAMSDQLQQCLIQISKDLCGSI